MPLPTYHADLEDAGYRFINNRNCSGCQAPITWYRTPKGKTMPFHATPEGQLVPHWADCPAAAQFRQPQPAEEEVPTTP
jgi:hypothetical protein